MKLVGADWLIKKPDSPSQWDDEFENADMDSRWTQLIPGGAGFTQVSSFDPYAGFTTGNHRYSLNKVRQSWLMVQSVANYGVGGNSANQGWQMDITGLPTNCFIYGRFSCGTRRASITDGDGEVGFRLFDALGTTYILTTHDGFGTIREALFARAAPAVPYLNLGLLRNYLGEAYPVEYIGIQKRNNTWDGWCAPASGNWVWMGSYTHLVPLTTMWLLFNNQTNGAPGNQIQSCDFVRVISGFGPP